MDCIWYYDSPLGRITMAGGEGYLTGLWFDGQKHFGHTLSAVCEERLIPVFEETVRWLDIYFSGEEPGFTPGIAFKPAVATPFRKRVWETLLTIPYGETVTYAQLASRIAQRYDVPTRVAPRATGGAVGWNPISLIVPCHRVIASNGSVGGYAAGQERKLKLLELESAHIFSVSPRNRIFASL